MDYIKLVPQQGPTDCGVACLATLLGLSYEDVYVAVAKVDKFRSKHGMHLTQIKKAAQALGRPLKLQRKFDPEEAVGILKVHFAHLPFDHVVVLWRGIIIDTDACLWDYDAYLTANEASPRSLLVLRDEAV